MNRRKWPFVRVSRYVIAGRGEFLRDGDGVASGVAFRVTGMNYGG